MNETCDRCGPSAEAMYRVYRDRELFLCGHCMNRLWEALCGKGWVMWPLGKHELRPIRASRPRTSADGPKVSVAPWTGEGQT